MCQTKEDMKNFTPFLIDSFRYSVVFIVLFSASSCLKMKSPRPDDPKQIVNEWRREADLPDYLRIGGMVHQTQDKVFLLPGSGAYHFASVPEIMSFDGEKWTYEFRYDGFASAGGGYWQHNGWAYNVCGVNGSYAPTRDVVAIDFESQSTHLVSEFLPGRVADLGSCSTSSKGYLTAVHTYGDTLRSIYYYDFESEIWDAMPKPTENENLQTLMATQADTLFLFYPTSDNNNLFCKIEGELEWHSLPDFPGSPRHLKSIHRYKNYLIVGMGIDYHNNENLLADIWVFNVGTSTWTEMAAYPGKAFHSGFIFEINDRLYIGGGATETTISKEVMNGEMWSIYLE